VLHHHAAVMVELHQVHRADQLLLQYLAWLERALAQRDDGMLLVKRDPLLRAIRPDPRWKELLRKMKLPVD